MTRIHGFEPIAIPGAHTLILGSMPSVRSLADHRYYAHPRNAFWPIITTLLKLPDGDYEATARAVARRGFAIWDVLRSCHRPGSLDADIRADSVVVNDFPAFLADQPAITRVFFNGTAAEGLFRRHAAPALDPRRLSGLRLTRLPSTSPANASLDFAAKLRAWRAILPGGDLQSDRAGRNVSG